MQPGTRVVAENANVRVLLHTATSGKTGAAHDHPNYLTVLIAGVTPRGGPGTITWTDGPFTHGGIPAAQALQAIVIELKSGSGTGKELRMARVAGTRWRRSEHVVRGGRAARA